jgi:hypothetical protein
MTYGALTTADQRQWPAQQNVSNLCVSRLECVAYPRNASRGQAAPLFDIKCQEMSGNLNPISSLPDRSIRDRQ